mmetsp:Transcript_9159/g.30156  ORF Transcript_9159/g.30156 Transcript_9159/m.30156 type:complete len:281 (-) Transcript_9159:44-886(-)
MVREQVVNLVRHRRLDPWTPRLRPVVQKVARALPIRSAPAPPVDAVEPFRRESGAVPKRALDERVKMRLEDGERRRRRLEVHQLEAHHLHRLERHGRISPPEPVKLCEGHGLDVPPENVVHRLLARKGHEYADDVVREPALRAHKGGVGHGLIAHEARVLCSPRPHVTRRLSQARRVRNVHLLRDLPIRHVGVIEVEVGEMVTDEDPHGGSAVLAQGGGERTRAERRPLHWALRGRWQATAQEPRAQRRREPQYSSRAHQSRAPQNTASGGPTVHSPRWR